MVGYYAIVGIGLLCDRYRRQIQRLAYRAQSRFAGSRAWAAGAWVIPAAFMCLPIVNVVQSPEALGKVTVCALGRYPVITAVSDRHRAIVVNAGDEYSASRTLFDVLRGQGASDIETAIVTGVHPETGHAGLAAIGERIGIGTCLVPVLPGGDEDFLDAVGDDYLLRNARDGERWAQDYRDAFDALRDRLKSQGSELRELEGTILSSWQSLRVEPLPAPRTLPDRFVSRARGAVLEIVVNETRWLVVTELDRSRIRYAIAAADGAFHGVIFPGHSSRHGFESVLDDTVRRSRAQVVIISNTRPIREIDFQVWAEVHPGVEVLETAIHGAVQIRPAGSSGVELEAYKSGWTRAVEAGDQKPVE